MIHKFVASVALLGVAQAGNGCQEEDTKRNHDYILSGKLEVISSGHKFAEGLAFDSDDNFYFTDVPAGKLSQPAENRHIPYRRTTYYRGHA